MTQPKYRDNVGLMIINKQGRVWLGMRADGAGVQMPQGGIDAGEALEIAAYRELYEETGLVKEKVVLLKESQEWYAYLFPKPIGFANGVYDGQRQKWFLFLHTGLDSDFNLEAHPDEIEFKSFSWYLPDEVVHKVVSFKRDVYQRVVDEFKPIILKVSNQK